MIKFRNIILTNLFSCLLTVNAVVEINEKLISENVNKVFGIREGAISLEPVKKEPTINDWNKFLDNFAKYASKYTTTFEKIRDASHDLVQLRTVAGAANLAEQKEAISNLIESINQALKKFRIPEVQINSALAKLDEQRIVINRDKQEDLLTNLNNLIKLLKNAAEIFKKKLEELQGKKALTINDIQITLNAVFPENINIIGNESVLDRLLNQLSTYIAEKYAQSYGTIKMLAKDLYARKKYIRDTINDKQLNKKEKNGLIRTEQEKDLPKINTQLAKTRGSMKVAGKATGYDELDAFAEGLQNVTTDLREAIDDYLKRQ